MTQVGDRVTYRGREAVVVTVFPNGSVNLVYGDTYSDSSDGIWPVAHAANVPSSRFEPAPDRPIAEVDESVVPGDDGDDADTQGDVVIKDDEDDVPTVPGIPDDFDADDFVDRTPVTDVAEDVRSGDYDAVLDAIEDAERNGKARATLLDAIESRR